MTADVEVAPVARLETFTNFNAETIRWRVGDESKPDPFFILVLNNIAIERTEGSGNFVPDLIGSGLGSNDKKIFTDSAEYIFRSLFGKLSGQIDPMLSLSPHAPKVKFHSMYVFGLVANEATALMSEEMASGTNIAHPRRAAAVRMLNFIGVNPDVLFIVTNSPTHKRMSAYPALDDPARGGVTTTLDGAPFVHNYHHSIPGMATMHTSANAELTAAHEFGHAFSSYPNAFVTDLYVDGNAFLNRKVGRPIPGNFCEYAGATFATDVLRDGIGYPPNWSSFHSELIDKGSPALMDNYYLAPGGALASQHDTLTRKFMLDRLAAKVSR